MTKDTTIIMPHSQDPLFRADADMAAMRRLVAVNEPDFLRQDREDRAAIKAARTALETARTQETTGDARHQEAAFRHQDASVTSRRRTTRLAAEALRDRLAERDYPSVNDGMMTDNGDLRRKRAAHLNRELGLGWLKRLSNRGPARRVPEQALRITPTPFPA